MEKRLRLHLIYHFFLLLMGMGWAVTVATDRLFSPAPYTLPPLTLFGWVVLSAAFGGFLLLHLAYTKAPERTLWLPLTVGQNLLAVALIATLIWGYGDPSRRGNEILTLFVVLALILTPPIPEGDPPGLEG